MKLPFLPLLLATLVAGLACPGPAQEKVTADAIIKSTGIDSGLALVIADDAALACDLADGGKLQVHLLAGRAESVEPLRAEVRSRGLGGRVVVQALAADGRLPHPDRFVNLIATALDRPDDAEIQRVLAVRGAAFVRRGGKWQTAAKAADAKIDGWFQHWYDATGNCVSHDRVAGFPEAVQWQHGPALEDGTADGKVVRVADGCLVTVDNATGDLVCRDAGNGLLRWRVPGKFEFRDDLAIFGGRIYCYYDPDPKSMDGKSGRRTAAPLAALDLLTGKLVQTYDQAKRMGDEKPVEVEEEGRRDRRNLVPWFVVSDQVIVQAYGSELVVLDRQTGRRRWEQKLDSGTWFSPTVAGDLVLAAETVLPGKRERYDASGEVRAVAAFGLADGRLRWRNEQVHPLRELTEKKLGLFKARAGFKPLTVAEGLVVIHTASYQARQGHTIAVLDATSGRELWQRGYQPGELYDNASQRVVVRAGEVILLDGKGIHRFEARTGKPLGDTITVQGKRTVRPNGACTSSRATVDWLMANAWLYVGPDGQPRASFGARSACGQGVVPANGLVFTMPTPCDCGDYTRGYQALAPKIPGRIIPDEARLTTGAGSRAQATATAGWVTFLGDPQRKSAGTPLPSGPLQEKWRTQAAKLRADDVDADRRNSERHLGALSAPVAGAGLVVVSAPETHEVLAFDAATGRPAWRISTGGKVDSPPTLVPRHGLAVFGCDDGAVYAVRLGDGTLAWRFLTARTDGVAMLHGHLASAFPIPGSVLVLGDIVIAIAGHHTDIGGLHCWALDVATGKPRAQRVIQSDRKEVVANGLAVADPDGKGFWIGRQLHLSLELEYLATGVPAMTFDRNGDRIRFRTSEARGGSTHGWGGAMAVGAVRGHRVVADGGHVFALGDPTTGERHPVRAGKSPVVRCFPAGGKRSDLVWTASVEALGGRESYSTLVKAGDRLYAGGGKRDGTGGFVQILDSKTGQLLATHELPSRVTECGMATTAQDLFISCEGGELVCLAGGR